MQEGTERHGMLFRINGAAIFTRGANVIPMDELEGWWDTSAHKILVQSALQGHFTMLRVWGGGAWLPDVGIPYPVVFRPSIHICILFSRSACLQFQPMHRLQAFYSECDRLGLLIYHDVMFAQNGHAPQATPTQVRDALRLGHLGKFLSTD
jgi:beta-mannosidase